MRQQHSLPCRAKRGQTFLYLPNPLFVVSLFGHRPAARDSRLSQPVGKPVLSRECNQTLRSLLSCACFPPILMEIADKTFGKSQTKGMG